VAPPSSGPTSDFQADRAGCRNRAATEIERLAEIEIDDVGAGLRLKAEGTRHCRCQSWRSGGVAASAGTRPTLAPDQQVVSDELKPFVITSPQRVATVDSPSSANPGRVRPRIAAERGRQSSGLDHCGGWNLVAVGAQERG
jgi:hypothetical protein